MTPKELVQTWFKNLDNEDFDSIRALMSENHLFHSPMSPEAANKDAHIAMMQEMTASFQGEHIIDHLIEEDGKVAVHGRWVGKHTGTFNGIPATGNDVNFTYSDLFIIEEGKVTNEYFELNPMTFMTQIGALEPQNA